MSLSQKILRRQADVVVQVVRDTATAVAAGTPADAALARFYRAHPEFGSRDRRLFSQVVFAYFRWKGWLVLKSNGSPGGSPSHRGNHFREGEPPGEPQEHAAVPPDLAIACVLAHALEADDIHPAMALLAESTGRFPGGLAPLGALPPAEKAAGFARMTGGTVPSLLDTLPVWCTDLLRVPPGIPAQEHLDRVTTAFQTPPPTWLRARPGCRERVLAVLRTTQRSSLQVEITLPPKSSGGSGSVPTAHREAVMPIAGASPPLFRRLPDAISIPRGFNLRALSPQLKGLMEIQDLASQAVGLVCAPRPDEHWWDACCGSGGKALHLADLMAGQGHVLATDVRPGILDEMARRMRNDAACIDVRQWDGVTPPDRTFDGILVDAPCSGLGTWHRNPDARWRMSPEEIERLAALQLRLLQTCSRQVKPGGALVYATCTLTAAENDQVTDFFLADAPDFSPSPFPSPLDGATCPGRLWIYPWQAHCNGMFIARFARQTA